MTSLGRKVRRVSKMISVQRRTINGALMRNRMAREERARNKRVLNDREKAEANSKSSQVYVASSPLLGYRRGLLSLLEAVNVHARRYTLRFFSYG